jgi:site-specific recombinase XerD
MGDNNQVTVRGGKNKKDRMVHMSAECTNVLICYLQSYPRKKMDYLFTAIVKNNPLATGDVRKTLRVTARRANIERRVYPHLLRHSLATTLLNRGASLMLIKNQLGACFYREHYDLCGLDAF